MANNFARVWEINLSNINYIDDKTISILTSENKCVKAHVLLLLLL